MEDTVPFMSTYTEALLFVACPSPTPLHLPTLATVPEKLDTGSEWGDY